MSKLSETIKYPFGYGMSPESIGLQGWFGGDDDEDQVTTTKYDPVASRKMAEIAEKQQAMAQQQWDMYKEYFMPYEIEAAQANRELLPLITEASKTTLGLQVPVTKEFYRQSLEGVDVGERVEQAGAEVISATRLGEGMRRREISRYGIDPSSTTYGDMANQAALATAKNVAGARTAARTQAKGESYAKLGYSLGRGVYQTQLGSGADPYARAAASYSGAASTYGPLANRVLGTTRTGPRDPYSRTGSLVGGILGTGIGAYFGGPSGAAVGYGIGSGIGGIY